MSSALKTTPKFCVNCKYFIPHESNDDATKCSFFKKENLKFLIFGKNNEYEHYYCSTARNNDNMCGKEAIKYVKRTKNTNREKDLE